MSKQLEPTKVSDALRSRMEHRPPRERMRAVVLLQPRSTGAGQRRRLSREERRKLAEAHIEWFTARLPEIDRILNETGGRRLAERPDALGSLPVETNPDGILALSASDAVKAILEDQPVQLVS
ncbi:MAG: hypothetical protein EA424_05725 [Planctomycetaceae bacterium]|nr:MAG: hypothetical protein EA424_05725 [Planctomycetaceae bacterium]